MKIEDIKSFKQQVLIWADGYEVCCYLDSNEYEDQYGTYDFIIAAGVTQEITSEVGNAFERWKAFYEAQKEWMFGFLSYDLKNELEDLDSRNPDRLLFPDLYFFVPKYLIVGKGDDVSVLIGDPLILKEIRSLSVTPAVMDSIVETKPRADKASYLDAVTALRNHILRGDIYEANLCQEFFAEYAVIDPLSIYLKLNDLSPTPFSGYFKHYHQYILSASPERFLRKKGSKLISQPIKGTAKRSLDRIEDDQNKMALQNNLKEQAENVMIVDLVRNDLTKSAVKGSVVVDELFGVYGFAQVYQMISTISCELNPEIHFIDAIRNAFPMGSMTGAPKLRAMQLIEETEASKRSVYSGALGYVTPTGDFDFNVIIRSILYNAQERYLSFQVGGAITYASEASAEYEECLLKASAILQTLQN